MKRGRKTSGGKYKKARKKKFYETPGQKTSVKLGEQKTKTKRKQGGSRKTITLSTNIANITDKKTSKQAKITNVIETPSNTFLARQNILTKGTIIKTEIGKAKITNRPSQEGNVQCILIKE